MHKQVKFLTLAGMLYLFAANISANIETPIAAINVAELAPSIKEYVHNKLSSQYDGEILIDVLQHYNSLHLKQCDVQLQFSLPEQTVLTNSTTVRVSCNGASPWTLYVPIGIKILQQVIITNRPMSRDEVITADVISLKNVDITNLNQGFYSDPMLVLGQIMRFPVKAGNVLTPQSITKNKLVKRGERVNISVEDPEILVLMQGESLDDGTFGDKIKVRNLSSKRIVEATIVAPGKVQIHL